MQPKRVAIPIGVFAIVLSTVVSAQQAGSGALMPGFRFEPKQKAPARPYVFRIPMPLARPAPDPADSSKPTVVCGMTLIPADPMFDAAIRKAPSDGGTHFAIERVPPRTCLREQR